MKRLDRPGIFQAEVMSWGLSPQKDGSEAVAAVIEYRILSQLNGQVFESWETYEPHSIVGYHYIIKRDGSINEQTCGQLALSVGWNGDLDMFTSASENEWPRVQITVKDEDYNGQSQLKVAWLNPFDFVPRQTMPVEDVRQLKNRYGGLLRAAAGAATKAGTPKKSPNGSSNAPGAATADEPLPWENQAAK